MILDAPCKINLGLDVLHRRDDGFHELRTLFVALPLADTLEAFLDPRAAGDSLRVEGPEGAGISAGPENLVLRAVGALRGEMATLGLAREAAALRLRLVKRVPHGAGLGGGSSDAAAALRAAGGLWRAPFAEERLARVAAQIGSDCAFFVRGGAALASGRGELLEPVHIGRSFAVVIAKPPCSVPTKGAYAGLDAARDFGERTDFAGVRAWLAGASSGLPALGNAFTRSVAAAHSEIAEVLESLRGAGGLAVQMSGSGSACFAVFGDLDGAERALRTARFPGGTRTYAVACGPLRA